MNLYANTSQIEITPELGTVINGEFTCRYANKIADPLYAKAFLFKQGQVILLIMVVDVCLMKREYLDPIKKKIAAVTSIPVEQQMISSTHTHSAGSVADLLLAHVDIAYRDYLEKQLIALASQVMTHVVPAKIAFGKVTKPQHLTCRRYKMNTAYTSINPVNGAIDEVKTNPFGLEDFILSRTTVPDPDVCYIALQTLEGEWLGILANYGLHYVGDCERGTISADYFGVFAKQLVSKLHPTNDMVVAMSNGTSGEINIWDFIDGNRYPAGYHEKSKLIGEDIAESIRESVLGLEWDEHPQLMSHYEDVAVSLRRIPNDILEQSRKIVCSTDYESLSYTDTDLMEKVYAREQLLLQHYPEVSLFPLQCFKIGYTIIGALGGEFFSETGLKLKQLYPQYFTICLANDYVGYVPPEAELAKGGYETWRCRSSYLDQSAEQVIRLRLSQIIEDFSPHEE
ncbi:hypothetical protein [Sphingobacterium sp. SYP-B4668]|uniref:hypothetical protein n=1 Tax=Sphingobacterium sp. SYP-B4668 TaxID=2996035 RepID=UPI0022DE2131|nr:hypothetical protein [Sphingobacterium sp. SYP-B4668]